MQLPAPLFPDQLPEGAAYDALVRRVMGNEIIRGKLLSNDGELTLVVLALDPSVVESNRLRDVVGEIRTSDGRGSRRCGTEGGAFRRSGDAARNPQRGRARQDSLQYDRVRRRLPHRDPFFPPRFLHDHRGWSAADRDIAGARRARLARFPPQYVPQRDDAADHGDQLLRQHAAYLRRARPVARGRKQIRGLEQSDFDRRASLRSHACDRRLCPSWPCSFPAPT